MNETVRRATPAAAAGVDVVLSAGTIAVLADTADRIDDLRPNAADPEGAP